MAPGQASGSHLCSWERKMDTMTVEQRSRLMSRIRGRDTKPELAVRAILRALGARGMRFNRKGLPGTPDVVVPSARLAVMVHGCFWHRHGSCKPGRNEPKSNRAFWRAKFERNVARDRRDARGLRKVGWRVAVVWECALRKPERVAARLGRLLEERSGT